MEQRGGFCFDSIRYANIPGVFRIDCFHNPAENLAVGRCVVDAIPYNVIMDHFVNNHVFQFVFRQIIAGVDSYAKVFLRNHIAEEVPFTGVCQFSDEGSRTAKFQSDRR